MKFTDLVDAARALLQRKGRVSYRGLAREFDLDDATLQDLAEELVEAERVAADEGGKVLVWTGPSTEAAAPARAADGERRQLTVMFCDLVGSTALSEQLDPEHLHEIVDAYQQASRDIIQRYEGHIAQYLGDGILAYFGYPAAHEDDAARAVRAGLDILAAVAALRTRVPLQVRLGLHTGLVVIGAVGAGTRAELLALGRTPNIAARVQASADPQTLVISADTHRLVQARFDCQDLGVRELKGIAEPMRLLRVHHARARHRADALPEQGLAPMQGREPELAGLLQAWQDACSGRGRAVLLRGEAGIGKSRLIQSLSQLAHQHGAVRLVLRCSPFHASSPLFPVVEQLSHSLQAHPDDTPGARWERLDALLGSAGLLTETHRVLFATLLSIPLPEGCAEPAFGREQRKALMLQALARWLLRVGAGQPGLVILEDLHWADPSTLEMLSLAVAQMHAAPVLIALTSRPEFTPPWPADETFAQLTLGRLDADAVHRVATAVAGKPLPQAVLDQLVRKTDGVPLYVEEMTKDLLESPLLHDAGDRFDLKGELPPLAVPFSLQDALASRLDRLGHARRLAETAAVLGREFSPDWLRALAETDDAALSAGLQLLCEVGILLRQEAGPDTRYAFCHALVQDAAYQSLLIRRRQQTHARAAELLCSEWAEQAALQPALVAHHYTEAGLAAPAVNHWERAGLHAVEQSANQEAIQHLGKALELLKTLPGGVERDRQELKLLLALGVPLAVTSGWAAPEMVALNQRAFDLCEALGETEQFFPVMFSLWSNRQVQGEFDAAQQLAAQLLALARRAQDDGCLMQAHRAHGINGLHTGRFEDALRHCDAGWALYRPERHRGHLALYWLDPGVGCLCYGAWSLLFLGRADAAVQRVGQALALARASGHAFSLAYALHFGAVLHQLRRDAARTTEHATELLALARAQGFAPLQSWATLMLGCAAVEQGAVDEGIERMDSALQAMRASPARTSRTGALAVLAAACLRQGDAARGLALVAEALALVATGGERFYEAELLRLRGELLLAGAPPPGPDPHAHAQADLERALAVARQQQAALWALRAATALARLQAAAGQTTPARDLLETALRDIAEGAALTDVRDAQVLLSGLS